MFLSVTLNGLMIGGLYVLMGIGFSLQWGISGIINLSFGSMTVLASFFAFTLYNLLGIQPLISALPIAAFVFVLGVGMYHFLLSSAMRKAPLFVTLIITFAVGLVIENFMLLAWGSDYRFITSPYSSLTVQLLETNMPLIKIIVLIFSFIVVYLVALFMAKTKTGKAIQAACLNPKGARSIGIEVSRMYAINFGLAAAIGAVAGALLTNLAAFSVVLSGSLQAKVFIIAILGGLGNIWGAALGGMVLALVESYAAITIGPQYNEAIGLVVMVLVLVLKPRGLIGKKYWDV